MPVSPANGNKKSAKKKTIAAFLLHYSQFLRCRDVFLNIGYSLIIEKPAGKINAQSNIKNQSICGDNAQKDWFGAQKTVRYVQKPLSCLFICPARCAVFLQQAVIPAARKPVINIKANHAAHKAQHKNTAVNTQCAQV